MTSDERLATLLRSDADSYQPGDGRHRILERARARRRARIARRVGASVLAAGVAAAIAVPLLQHSGTSGRTTITMPPPSTQVVPPTTAAATTTTAAAPSTTISPAAAAAALNAYLSAHQLDAYSHSQPLTIGRSIVAVVALEPNSQNRSVQVLDLSTGTARTIASLVLPTPYYDFASLPVQVADVTGDGQPDFLVRVSAGDNNPGVVVSDDGGAWRLVPVQTQTGSVPAGTDVYVGRDPSFTAGHLQSTYNNCVPNCAAGHVSTQTWTYVRPGGYFSTSQIAPPTSSYYVDGPSGTPHYVMTVATSGSMFSGWMFFVYQDGHISVNFHYHGTRQPGSTFTVTTDTTTQPFPYSTVPPGSLGPGSSPTGPGHTYTGTYTANTFTFQDCGSALYWANPSNPSPESCSFTYNGSSL